MTHPPFWKQCFVFGHICLIGLAIFQAFWRSEQNPMVFILKWWMVGNSIFILSTGEYWAYHSFDRYFTWALPAYSYFIGDMFKWSRCHLALLACVSSSVVLYAHVK